MLNHLKSKPNRCTNSSSLAAAHTRALRRIDDTNGTQNVSFRTQNELHKCGADNNVEGRG